MSILTRNEIITLTHLSDGQQHGDIPKGLTSAQYYTALKKLKEQDMVYASFIEGGTANSAQIKMSGQAVVDDFQFDQKRILRNILKEKDLTPDQYELLTLAAKERIDFCYNEVQAKSDTDQAYHKLVFDPIEKKSLAYYDRGIKHPTEIIISRLGKQLLEDIHDELYNRLSTNEPYTRQGVYQDEDKPTNGNQINEPETPVKIKNGKKSTIVFALMALYRNNAFNTNLDRDATIDYILNALGEKGNNNVSQILSVIFNRAKTKTPEAFITELVDEFRKELNEGLEEEKRKKSENK